jgi:hypothetical protein
MPNKRAITVANAFKNLIMAFGPLQAIQNDNRSEFGGK